MVTAPAVLAPVLLGRVDGSVGRGDLLQAGLLGDLERLHAVGHYAGWQVGVRSPVTGEGVGGPLLVPLAPGEDIFNIKDSKLQHFKH